MPYIRGRADQNEASRRPDQDGVNRSSEKNRDRPEWNQSYIVQSRIETNENGVSCSSEQNRDKGEWSQL
jgi:hypothetical protein